MSAPRSRQYRRVAQACDNCRPTDMIADDLIAARRSVAQVKDRDVQHVHVFANNAPSPKPTLSMMIPLVEWRLACRLEQLEDKLDNLISRVVPPSMQERDYTHLDVRQE
ncbi:unnamed protein product [Fusarium fujikuroi]|uniref:Uncharacterized protein n=1 Tax=Fusarium fujikuroi TaxID=5127 RepID=A0A9Q9UGW7_FUSFU|nr:unnamed protein product [Fusarium fujikuroi]